MTALKEPSPSFVEALKARLGPSGWRDPSGAPSYFEEPRGKFRGRAALIVRPDTTKAVADIIAHCAAERVGVVPWGGGTGLVGGQTALDAPAPILLSLERLNRIRAVSPEDNAITVEAGCSLETVQNAAGDVDRLFPLSYASQGSAQIGGALAVNSGGVQVLRYGNARDLCLGLEAVLPNGSIHHGLKNLRKDNTGYDLKHLLIGSEGTLGAITAATLKLFPRPREIVAAFCAIPSPAAAVSLLRTLQASLGDVVAAFELISRRGVDFLAETGLDHRDPVPHESVWRALVEVGGHTVREPFEAAMARALEDNVVLDGVLAESEAQRAAFWRLRESIPEANRRVGAIASHDISVPVSRVARFIDDGATAIAGLDPRVRVNCFGHIGDGNLHYNIFPPAGEPAAGFRDVAAPATRLIHDLVHRHGGSFSAEHGVGRLKRSELARYGDPAKLSAMQSIKAVLDPLGIMNPGCLFYSSPADRRPGG